MTARELQYRFGIQLNQLNEALELSSDDIQYWLNKGQLQVTKELFNGDNIQGKGFEQSQQRVDDLRNLVVKNYPSDTIYDDDSGSPTGFFVDKAEIPEDNLFLISSRSLIKYEFPEVEFSVSSNKREAPDAASATVSNKYMQLDDIYTVLDDPFNTTLPHKPIVDINEDYINVYTDKTFIVDKVFINYLRLPVKIDIREGVTSELNEQLHDDIIQRGVDLFLQNTRELKQRLQRETPVSTTQRQQEDE